MATLNISLPEPMRTFVEAQVNKGGYSTASEYLRELIREAQKQAEQEELEAKLLEALKKDAKEMTAKDWKEIRQQVRERHQRRKKA